MLTNDDRNIDITTGNTEIDPTTFAVITCTVWFLAMMHDMLRYIASDDYKGFCDYLNSIPPEDIVATPDIVREHIVNADHAIHDALQTGHGEA